MTRPNPPRRRNMVPTLLGFAFAASAWSAGGCQTECGDSACAFNKREWGLIQKLSPLPEPELDPTNRYDDKAGAVTLGQKLFWETRYSTALRVASTLGAVGDTQKVNCVVCHDPENGFADARSMPNHLSVGVSWTTRNSPSLVNIVYYKDHGWDRRQDTLWNQGTTTPETGTNSNGDRCQYSRMLWTHYREEYNALFDTTPLPDLDPTNMETLARFPLACKPKANAMAMDGNWEKMAAEDRDIISRIMSNQGKAVAAYEAKLVSRKAPFDSYVAGDNGAITDKAKRGLDLFIGKAACVECHSGPLFSDQISHNIGVAQKGANVPMEDLGVFAGIPQLMRNSFNSAGKFSDDAAHGTMRLAGLMEKEADKGAFRTPMLRNIAASAPYMHTGQLATLKAVVDFYNKGGDPDGFSGTKDTKMRELELTEAEMDDLVAFLETLTGEAIPGALRAAPTLP